MLHDAVVLLRRGNQLPALIDAMRTGLLDVNVLAGLAAPNRSESVPMIGRRDADAIDALVVEHTA